MALTLSVLRVRTAAEEISCGIRTDVLHCAGWRILERCLELAAFFELKLTNGSLRAAVYGISVAKRLVNELRHTVDLTEAAYAV